VGSSASSSFNDADNDLDASQGLALPEVIDEGDETVDIDGEVTDEPYRLSPRKSPQRTRSPHLRRMPSEEVILDLQELDDHLLATGSAPVEEDSVPALTPRRPFRGSTSKRGYIRSETFDFLLHSSNIIIE
jgi:hypothetical protein